MKAFLQKIFHETALSQTFEDPLEYLLCSDHEQDWGVRNVLLPVKLVALLIDDRGELDQLVLNRTIHILEDNLYSLAPNLYHDQERMEHLLQTLRLFDSDRDFSRALKKIYCPEEPLGGQKLIRETLFLPKNQPVTDADARRAALAALLTFLRQTVGSCFATAPAILVQQEQPLHFLEDIAQLFAFGHLTRIFEGVEHTVPLNTNWGGSSSENALLKGWEYTLASLSESKADFAKWNFFTSLGVKPEEPFGVGESVHAYLQEKMDQLNEEMEVAQSRYDHLFAQVKSLEGRMQRVSTSNEMEWLRSDYRMRRLEINRALNERDEAHEKGQRLAKIFPFIIDFYGKKLRDYFQEVYDPELHGQLRNPYDDSPAGFRLLYKHGRANPAMWTLVYTADEYLDHLTAFFIATEVELTHLPEVEGLEKELSQLVTTMITAIRRPEFLKTSSSRLARAYGEREGARTPWAYISGGTMQTFVSCYYVLSDKPKEEKTWVESPNELLAFYIDTLKRVPQRTLLAFSPTHAFLCKPDLKLFQAGWESDEYTYSWIRDHWFNPHQRFLDEHILDEQMMLYFVEHLRQITPERHFPTNFVFPLRANEFRKYVQGGDELDSLLYNLLPLFPGHDLKKRLEMLFEPSLREKVMAHFEEIGKYQLLSAQDLRRIAKGLLMKAFGRTRSAIPYHQKLTETMQTEGLAYPAPILVADTNWVNNVFGFTVNPGTGETDFWRFDACGSEGRPISIWREYLDGTTRKDWGFYTDPKEYQ